jgi:predicted O-methyltransferase YrrM
MRRITAQHAVAIALLVGVASAAPAGVAAEEAGAASDPTFTANWTKLNEAVWLEHLKPLVGRPGAQGLEVGCFEGRSTIWFLENVLTAPDARMTCIDVFTDAIEARFDKNIALSGQADRVIKKKGYSQDVLRGLELGYYDFIYIDGCHLASCVMTDTAYSWDLLKPGGILIFDDYVWGGQKPPRETPGPAVDLFLDAFSDRIDLLYKDRQVLVRKRGDRENEARVGQPIVHTPEWEEFHRKAREQRKLP